MSDYIDADRAAAILGSAPEPSPERLAALRSLDRAYERIKADALARYNAAAPIPSPATPDPGAAPATPPFVTSAVGRDAAD